MTESSGVILYIDDEEELCKLFQMTFETAQHKVQTFSDPGEALAYLAQNSVAMVFCDFRMPTMDALEFYGRMPEELQGSIPFYIVTGLTSATSFEIPRFVSGVYSKPLNSAEIRSVIQAGLASD